jgi:hypothetical protein
MILSVMAFAGIVWSGVPAGAQRPPTDRHVPELSSYLDRVEIAEPVTYRRLAVYPILLERDPGLRSRWLMFDEAVSRGVLVVREKEGGSVPVVVVENRSRDEHVLILPGEVISGGKQTRTARQDVVVAPGQRVELSVFCVEAHRWEGGKEFLAAKVLVPQSIQQELRRGADQNQVWAEVARNNAALKAENPTGSLELALKSAPVREKLSEVRRSIVPNIPRGTLGFIFVDRGRALGAEFFGNEELARDLLPKLLDSYAVDCIVLGKGDLEPEGRGGDRAAIDFFERICRAGSQRANVPGSGAGIRTRTDGLLGDGVSLGGTLVHFGVQSGVRIVPLPMPRPHPRIWPPERD